MNRPAQRIVSLSPDLTELVYALGAGKSFVGVIKGSDYPPQTKKLTRVGDYHALDFERILALAPDLILAWSGNSSQQIAQLKRLGLPVFMNQTRHLLDIPHTMLRLGCLTGKEEEANKLTRQFLKRYASLKQNDHASSRVSVFYQLAAHPLMTINQDSWINEAIELCGGKNIFARVGLNTPFKHSAFTVSHEAVFAANPELILSTLPQDWRQEWRSWPTLAAVKEKRLISMNPDLIERAGPRILDGVEAICHAIINTCEKKQGMIYHSHFKT